MANLLSYAVGIFPTPTARIPVVVLGLGLITIVVVFLARQLVFHPLAAYPGPFLAKCTDLYAAWHAWRGTLHLDMYRCHKKYGPVVRYAPGRLLINSNTAVKAISSHGANVIKSKAYGALVHGAPNTLTLRNKKEHARRRKILSMALSDAQMRLYEAKMLEHIEAMCSNLDDASAATNDSPDESAAPSSRALDMAVLCEHLTFDVICDIAFGLSPNTLKNDKYRFVPACITESNVRIGALVQASILSIAKLDKYLFPQSIKARNRFLGFLVWLIRTRKGLSPSPGAKRSDVFSYVETAKNPDDGSMLSRDEVQAESATLIVAGSDTTSTTVAATLFYLTGNPRAYDRLRKEVRTAFRSASEIRTGDQVNSCVFLRACINEALRMSPPVGGALWREVLPGGLTLEVGSRGGSQPSQTVFVPPGVDVGTGIYSLHRHEDYFDSPSEYRPERWLVAGENGGGDQADGAATAEAVDLAWSAFFPFSSGQRSCVGKGLAYVEATLTLAHILYRFDFCRDESMPVGGEYVLKDHVTSAKSGPWLRFTRAARDEEPQAGVAEDSRAAAESEIRLGHGNDDEAAAAAAVNASSTLDDVPPPPNSPMDASSSLEQHRSQSPVLSESSRFSCSASTCSETSRPESALSAPELDSPKGESKSLDVQEVAVAQEMHPETRRNLGHILLIELLAIETQEWIAEAVQAERIIEIGPGNTLTNMMKKTLQASADRDEARGIRRRILSLDSDRDEIYYRFDPASEQPEHPDNNGSGFAGIKTESSQQTAGPAETPSRGSRGASSLVDAAQEPAAATTTGRDATPGAMIPDEAIDASSVLVSIVGAKLKKHPSDIDKSSTIGKLTGGRSTRSNELVGDLQVEFGEQIPDSAAELPIEELCLIVDKAQQATGRTELGKTATGLVSTMLSNTLPGTFGPSKARSHLQSRWRVGPHRQNAIFLSALPSTQSAGGRKGDAAEAMVFLDDIAAAYLEKEGLEARQPVADVDAEAVAQKQATERNDGLYHEFIEMLTMNLGRAATVLDEKGAETNAVDAGLCDLRDELGDTYAQGVASMFNVKKQRVYKSFWNWVPQDILRLSRMAFQPGRGAHKQQQQQQAQLESVEDLMTRIANRACGRSIDQLLFHLEEEETKVKDKENHEIRRVLRSCMEACQSSLSQAPLFVDREPRRSPTIFITDNGDIEVRTVPRMPSGDSFVPSVRFFGAEGKTSEAEGQRLSSIYMEDLARAREPGLTFTGKSVLVTGAGQGSIGVSIVENLLRGGARVTVATRSYSADTTKMYADLYAKYGSRGSELRVVPFNQGSRRDVEALAAYCCGDAKDDVGGDGGGGIDFVLPFAVMAESNRDLEDLDSHAELAHRVALVNVLRLLGAIVRNQRLGGRTTKPVTAVLPLSPNHGLMGGDGLYSESKRGLEAVFARWRSEGWHDYMALLGVVIGWTRGTGIMSDNDVLAPGVEAFGVRTFSRGEMAAHIVTMMGGRVADACQSMPLIVDLGGGLAEIPSLKEAMTSIRRGLRDETEIKIAIQREAELDNAVLTGQYPPEGNRKTTTGQGERKSQLAPRAKLLLPLPTLPDYKTHIAPLARSLEGMVDLSRVVVITGFSELGPCGNSRTRWEMEKGTPLSLDGCVELAWMMGLIKHERRHLGKDASPRSGWVDAATGEPVEDSEVGDRYREWISEHTGLRKIEPELCDNGYDPAKSASVHEVVVERDLPPFETSPEVAEELKRQHGNRVAVFTSSGVGAGAGTHSGASPTTVTVQIKAGATILVPKASQFSRSVAGQIPTGWSAKRYGIDEDLVNQIDRATLYALVCTVEALLCSGIVDPYEMYQHVHISEVGSCIGSSMGGLSSLRKMHRDRFLGEQVQGDILQETFANTTGAWVNMLLMGSAGPLKTPVGACATSLEALDTGYDLLVRGKAKMCIVGGLDDFSEDVSREFGRMNATCNTDSELAAGRTPREMSRPTASSRQGFVESQGCGIQVLTTAELALRMGLPIFGVVAYTSMAADGIGRSVPAPGRGILTNARERRATSESAAAATTAASSSSSSGAKSPNKSLPSPLLDLRYRRRLRDQRLWLVDEELRHRKALLGHDASRPDGEGGVSGKPHERTYWDESFAVLDEEARRQREDIVYSLGNDFWKADPTISPLRGSLATWGLGINDIGVASLHGTSTVANDVNEAAVIQQQMAQLGRLPGNLLPCVTQKWLTGHGKGAAGAWMINGCLQMMDTGLVPGNPNADDIEPELERHQYLLFPSVPIQVGDGEHRIIKACSVTSFGFGQKGSQALLVHPRHLFATVSETCYEEYEEKRQIRWQRACRRLTEGMVEENMVRVQTEGPYTTTSQATALLEPAKGPSHWP
ncbi:Putative cytochrome P450, phosphopantetheine binding ACP domain, beta-ketoacyl synthase, thiolase [Colletotrichum destructivum]|uniref:Cytochrome P450, phosphopantetheine binding ACP domain, beta-ketoacyl synthase, thiolase n=1 Tax=Colletotrichum destructivum TaxID=34406 RepID=A0AAX4J166_9PEZI|nr:Putative cytochrome P450, phosphopantetheine binding ACP domain, beta-ketoacyl synthase, thiolase [Colletotrichum destructivum]